MQKDAARKCSRACVEALIDIHSFRSAASSMARWCVCVPAFVSAFAAPIAKSGWAANSASAAVTPPPPRTCKSTSICASSRGDNFSALAMSESERKLLLGNRYRSSPRLPSAVARFSIASTCSTKSELYCSLPSSKYVTLYGAGVPRSFARCRPRALEAGSAQQYSTRSARESGVLDSVVVMIGSMPRALHIAIISKGPHPPIRHSFHCAPLDGRAHGGPVQSCHW
mmetsp:Transcript_68816/g.153582  ORF Transcript_68816/g.153582 Transcript_68816/m.153582 type:complete len:226 (-) Transcript_68816:918-1595(-)